MSRSHHKRLGMPRTWPLTRKTNIWAQKPNPSGHQIEMCMPLGIAVSYTHLTLPTILLV